MEIINEKERNLIGTERLVLFIFTIYCLNLCFAGINNGWEGWAVSLMVGINVLCWIAHIIKYRNYTVRAMLLTVGISLCIFFHGVHTQDLAGVLPTMFVLVGLVGILGVLEMVLITGGLMGFLIIRQCYILAQSNVDRQVLMNQIFHIGNVLFYVIIIYIWVYRRIQSGKTNQQALEERMNAEKARDDFVANVSHEIRTPLNIIYGTTQTLQTDDASPEIRKEIDVIAGASRRLMSMVSDILDFSELSSEEIELEEEVYDITSTINDIINMTVAQMDNKRLELVVDMDSKMPKLLMGDEKKIRRVIMNLINNAIKFTNSGCIILKISGRRESYGINLQFSVQDSGIGMKEEEVEKLFSRYNQADTSRNRKEEGIGLGIAICQLLARTLGGVITVKSKPQKGSTFTFVVPQKIAGDLPVVEISNKQEIRAAYYFDMENYYMAEIRDAYTGMIGNLIEQFGVPTQLCRNLEELKRKVNANAFTHVFINQYEYREDPAFFDEIAKKIRVAVIVDETDKNGEISDALMKITKPFYALQVAMVFNSEKTKTISSEMKHEFKFTAPNAKILVVDDNQMNIRVVKNLMKKYEVKVEQALSGAEALEKIESQDYDFIFMDHMMPEMDGVECTHRIRAKMGSYYQKVSIVALTANAIAGSREMFLREGFNDFLEKPVEPSVLERVLRRNIPAEKQIPVEVADDKPADTAMDNKKQAEMQEKTQLNETATDKLQEDSSSEKSVEDIANKIAEKIAEKFTEKKDQAKQEEQKQEMQKQEERTWEKMSELHNLWDSVDKEAGMMYCGGEDSYYIILAECVNSYVEMASELEEAFEKKDYPNYIIKIHALKSTMKSIGAMDLSEKARVLEFAGKAEEYDKITNGHREVMEEYFELMSEIAEVDLVKENFDDDYDFMQEVADKMTAKEGSATIEMNLEEISEEEIKALKSSFEGAMYSLDESQMRQVLEGMKGKQYAGKNLTELAGKMQYKIERGDFFSAGEILLGL